MVERMTLTEMIDARERQLIEEAEYWKAEAKHWEKKYSDELMRSIQHGEVMMSNFIAAAIGVVKDKDAIS